MGPRGSRRVFEQALTTTARCHRAHRFSAEVDTQDDEGVPSTVPAKSIPTHGILLGARWRI